MNNEMKHKKPDFILAGRFSEAQYIAQNNGLKGYEWKYLNSPHQLLGLKNPHVWLFGTYKTLYNYNEIEHEMKLSEATTELAVPHMSTF